MSLIIQIPTAFRNATGGEAVVELELSGQTTVKHVLERVAERHPELPKLVLQSDGNLQRHVNIFVNGLDVRFCEGLATPVSNGDEIQIVPAIAGGIS
ncbi:MAG: MoaD/ThiS family protein [Candidatus Hydrogenedentota bacterium]|nr:MAG: MoaD/ThiS family protein [Candidatus Hydrogenedentota bacterium]